MGPPAHGVHPDTEGFQEPAHLELPRKDPDASGDGLRCATDLLGPHGRHVPPLAATLIEVGDQLGFSTPARLTAAWITSEAIAEPTSTVDVEEDRS